MSAKLSLRIHCFAIVFSWLTGGPALAAFSSFPQPFENDAAGYQIELAVDPGRGQSKEVFSTIGDALATAQQHNAKGHSVRITVQPGVYRETLSLHPYRGETDIPLSIEGLPGGRVIVSGSDLWVDWQPHKHGVYSKRWPYRWGYSEQLWRGSADLPDIVRRREMVFFNGARLRQVLSRSEMIDGTFFVSEKEGRLYVQGGDNANLASVEVAVRNRLLHINRNKIA